VLTWGGEHDEAISVYALQMQARRLLRRHCPSPPSSALTPRNDDSEVFQQSPCGGFAPIEANGRAPSELLFHPMFMRVPSVVRNPEVVPQVV
jgi:hypothetical protein